MLPETSDLLYNWALVRLAAIDATEMQELMLDVGDGGAQARRCYVCRARPAAGRLADGGCVRTPDRRDGRARGRFRKQQELRPDLASAIRATRRPSDTAADRSFLPCQVGTPTIAILGNGLDRVYPKLNEPLAQRIVANGGLLLSELPFEVPPVPRNLIARDRLQSGLAAAVVVAQTGVKGGAMHTARFAAEQGRPIFCPVPHGENGKSEGLRVLLERPGRELCEVIPAWKQARSLCARLGTQPVARPVEREQLDLLLDSLELALVRPAERDQQALLFPTSIEA